MATHREKRADHSKWLGRLSDYCMVGFDVLSSVRSCGRLLCYMLALWLVHYPYVVDSESCESYPMPLWLVIGSFINRKIYSSRRILKRVGTEICYVQLQIEYQTSPA